MVRAVLEGVAFNSRWLLQYVERFVKRRFDEGIRIIGGGATSGWHLIGLQRPAAVHICVTARQAQPGVPERFVQDLRASVAHMKATPGAKGGWRRSTGWLTPCRSAASSATC